ncbi:RNA-processing protein, HAT helix [Corchorus capsularis]|uniref:RNA-processing protein, HAT helix n=1 Tax=Corchorus capsularis TaxID=210143 RepID=A0A1R3HJB9_COCAP|nr:RNA-processing protein, HAT helix [Corchorus capsularis]
MSKLYPSESDLLYEEELLRNPFNLKLWLRYLVAQPDASFQKKFLIYERALKSLPGSYKLWHCYLLERLKFVRDFTVTHPQWVSLNNTFERALVTMHKMPRVWIMYLSALTQQKLITKTRRTFDRALRALPVTQHDRIWEQYLGFVNQNGIPIETQIRVYRRYLKYDPSHVEDFIEFLVNSTKPQEAAERRKRMEKARDIFEEGMKSVVTVRDFSVIFDAYAQFEESMVNDKVENMDLGNGDHSKLKSKFAKNLLKGFWLHDKNDVDLRLAKLEHLMNRRPELANSVLLRQNPHNVEQWHRRVELFEGNPTKQILTYAEAVRTIDPMKAVGKPHTLWVAFAKLYETYNDLSNARVIFDKAVQVNYKSVDHLASVWAEWAEMELRHGNSKAALGLVRQATAEPSLEIKRKVGSNGNEPIQMNLHKSLRLWTLYVDLEERLGSLESTCSVYERILDLRIATPQIVLNYASLLLEKKYYEDAFKVYERGVNIFKYPHVKDIWETYLSNFMNRYGKTKLERARELFEQAIKKAPADEVKPLFLQYAKLEEEYGLRNRAMKVYDQATKAVPNHEKLGMYEIYIARAAEHFGLTKTREIYEQAKESDLSDKDLKTMCLKYAELEKSLGETDRARGIYVYASQFADPHCDADFWDKWTDFEVQHGNEDTFREMSRIKRSVSASYSPTAVFAGFARKKEDKGSLDSLERVKRQKAS